MFIITGYLAEVGDNDKGQPSMTFDVGGDRMLTVDCVTREDCQAVAPYLNKLICVGWGGAQMHLFEVGDNGAGFNWDSMMAMAGVMQP